MKLHRNTLSNKKARSHSGLIFKNILCKKCYAILASSKTIIIVIIIIAIVI